MKPSCLVLCLSLFLPSSVIAQTTATSLQGFYYNCETGATSRGHTSRFAGMVLTRIDHDDYRGWGQDGSLASLAKRSIWGFKFTVQDQNAATRESFTLQGFGEDKSKPNLPDRNDNFLNTGPTQLPPGNATARAYVYTMRFQTPVKADTGEDLFVGIGVTAQPAWTGDGVSLWLNLGYSPNLAFFKYDLPGWGMSTKSPLDSYGIGWREPIKTNAPVADSPRQYYMDPFVSAVNGVATATTRQFSYSQSFKPPGTASFFSGLHPDARFLPRNSNRKDNIGYRTRVPALAGKVVAFFVSPDFGPVLPLGTGRGVSCLDLRLLVLMGAKIADKNGEAFFHFVIPDAIRPKLPRQLVWQAFGLDFTTLGLWGTPCAKQRFLP